MEKKKMITQSTILNLGWTKSMISRLLPDPVLKRNPHGRNAPEMKLWPEKDVFAMMETAAYKEAKEKADKRKSSAKKGVQTRIENLCTYATIHGNNVQIIILEDEELRKRALKSQELIASRRAESYRAYMERQRVRDKRNGIHMDHESYYTDEEYYEFFDEYGEETEINIHISDPSEENMMRWVVNYIRHELTHYNYDLKAFVGEAGRYKASLEFKLAVLDRIAECYPKYAEECARQKEHSIHKAQVAEVEREREKALDAMYRYY